METARDRYQRALGRLRASQDAWWELEFREALSCFESSRDFPPELSAEWDRRRQEQRDAFAAIIDAWSDLCEVNQRPKGELEA